MNKDVKNFMSDNPEAFEAVLTALDELIDCRYLLAESKITALLQKIAGSTIAYELFDNVLHGYDYSGEFISYVKRTAIGAPTIVLPQDNKKIAAFVFCLLLDIDTGKCVFGDLLATYFYRETTTGEFALFVRTVLEPFRDALNALYAGDEEPQETQQEEEVQEAQEGDDGFKALFGEVKTVSDKLGTLSVDEGKREQVTFAVGALSEALSSPNKDNVRLAYMALKDSVSGIEQLESDVAAIGERLGALGVIAAA